MNGKLALHWLKTTTGQRGTLWREFLSGIRSIPTGTLWRHNQAGDLPGVNNRINATALRELTRANNGKRGFTYTHKPTTGKNLKAIREANAGGFTINLSANNLRHADRLMRHKLPVAVVLPQEDIALRSQYTPAGHKVVTCPAIRSESITCKTCGLCQKQDRGFIVGFPAHGAQKRKATLIALNA